MSRPRFPANPLRNELPTNPGARNNIAAPNVEARLAALEEALRQRGQGAQFGDIKATASTTTPAGWLLCAGQAISRTTYAELFAAVGTTYGAGDGSTTFNVPDLRGRTIAGLDNMNGTDAGRLDWANTLGTAGGQQVNATHKHYTPGPYGTNSGNVMTMDSFHAAGGAAHWTRYGNQFYVGNANAANWGKTPANGAVATEQYVHPVSPANVNDNSGNNAGENELGRMQPTMLLKWCIYAGA